MSPPTLWTCPFHPLIPDLQPLPPLLNLSPYLVGIGPKYSNRQKAVSKEITEGVAAVLVALCSGNKKGKTPFLPPSAYYLSFSFVSDIDTTNTRPPSNPLILPPLSLPGIFHRSFPSQILSLLISGISILNLLSLSFSCTRIYIYIRRFLIKQPGYGGWG